MTAAAWHPDPTGRHELRYWDGSQWTDHVSDQGVQSTSPLYPTADPAGDTGSTGEAGGTGDAWVGGQESAQTTEAEGATGTGAEPAFSFDAETAVAPRAAEQAPEAVSQPYQEAQPFQEAQPHQQAQPYQQAQPAAQPMGGYGAQAVPSDAFAGISGELIDGRFSEIDGAGAILQNKRLLRVRITEPFMAKQGAMVAYQGNVNFNYQGGGAAKFLKKAFTGEGLSLMRVEGQGDVFLADGAHEVHILHLNNSGLSVNGQNVLGFSASLEWNVERVKGGSMAAGGLFNTTLRGTGWVAITTDGDPVVLNPGEAPTFADANALVAWSTHLQTSIRSTFTAGALIGRGSGEAFQVAFQGQGFVIVQPSEGGVVPPHTH
ncbi:AIM24 family protein [Nocardioides carbamazepini]|uniref:AIM24 family protein n=1 Tax=Nocardioides carbamazepini TaxID=2854259 RepID=UPI00214A2D0A|nr:AIM24 family protein [Nocardioides carbamazepini]